MEPGTAESLEYCLELCVERIERESTGKALKMNDDCAPFPHAKCEEKKMQQDFLSLNVVFYVQFERRFLIERVQF